MPAYVYRCPSCAADFDRSCPVARRDDPVTCPTCGVTQAEKDGQGRLAARRLQVGAILVPGHFGRHVHTTGLVSQMGNGPWQDLNRKRNRWDSGMK